MTPAPLPEPAPRESGEGPCDICGGNAVGWRKCKLICASCGTILKSCADL